MFSISNQNIIAVNVTSTTMSIFMKGFPFLPHGGRNDTKQFPLYILLHVSLVVLSLKVFGTCLDQDQVEFSCKESNCLVLSSEH